MRSTLAPKKAYQGSSVACGCGESARRVNWRAKTITSALGSLSLEFPYDHCRHCSSGQRSWEQVLRISVRKLTVAAEELTALAGVLSSFDEAADKTLRKLGGIRLSKSTVQRVTEDAGRRLRQMLDKQVRFQPPENWNWHRDAAGRRCGYVGLDATGVRQQGPGSAKADCRMAYVGMIYNPPPRGSSRPIGDRRYLAGLYELEDLGRQLHREALSVGWCETDVQIALSDGATCLEKFLATYFPKAVLILDFFHAAGHLAELARTLYSDEAACCGALKSWCHTLQHQGGGMLLAELDALDPSNWNAAMKESWRKESGYLRNNLKRTDYPTYLANGWQIGSGPIEAACKTVIGARMKGAGMRWKLPGTDANLRACYLSDTPRWDSFWKNTYLQN